MNNTPVMKIGIVAVSRDCFPESLSVTRRQNLVKAYEAKYGKGDIYECPVCIVESEIHMMQALEDIKNAGCNALCVYLGNFGPEIAETMLAKNFNGPKMFIAAAEETSANGGLVQGRGDAYCGMLNASYNLKLRGVKAYIPEYPVGTAEECADMIHEFIPVAKAVYALSNLKIISFGPRPNNFLACNAPIAGLYNLGVEIEENSAHSGEYIPKHWEARKWISGFTGSAGTVVVTLDKAGLWTDSRYFLQAAEQLENTGITLFKERLPETPSIVEWLGCVLNAEDNVGIDGWVNSYQETSNLQKELEKKQIHLTLAPDPFNELWTDRPALPDNKVFIHELKYAGLSCKDKITQIREAIRRNSCTGILISALDEVAWTLNLLIYVKGRCD